MFDYMILSNLQIIANLEIERMAVKCDVILNVIFVVN